MDLFARGARLRFHDDNLTPFADASHVKPVLSGDRLTENQTQNQAIVCKKPDINRNTPVLQGNIANIN